MVLDEEQKESIHKNYQKSRKDIKAKASEYKKALQSHNITYVNNKQWATEQYKKGDYV